MLKDSPLLIGYVLLALGLSQATYLPDYEYIQGVGWLRLHIVPATWPDAQLRCHLEDATLTAPTTSAITAVMKETMDAHRLAEGSVFTDIYASKPKGDFTSINGLPMSNITLQWAVGEPNNLGNEEDCLVMTGAGELADVSCSSVHPFFCLKRNATSKHDECDTRYIVDECSNSLEVNQSNPTYKENECNCTIEANQCNTTQEANQSNTTYNENECNCTIEANQCNTTRDEKQCKTRAQGYTFEPRTGSCYKFHRTAVPWHRAAMKCASEHAHLAIINSEEESEILKEIFEQNPPSTITDAVLDNSFSVGYVMRNQNRWLTVLGETMDEAGYYKLTGDPRNWSNDDFCGVMKRSGSIHQCHCTVVKFAYICEISPKS